MSWIIEENNNHQIVETESLKDLKQFFKDNRSHCPVTVKKMNTDFWFYCKGPNTTPVDVPVKLDV